MKKTIRPAIFKWRQTEPELILCAVRWYLRYTLSFRDVEELLGKRTVRMFGNKFSSSTSCLGWLHETDPGRPNQALSC